MSSDNAKRNTIGGRFYIGNKLGSGLQADVYHGSEISSGQEVALKIINKQNVKPKAMQSLEREVNIMKALRHPNILTMKDVDMSLFWEERNVAMIVLELADGGELFDYLMYSGYFDDSIARTYFHQLVDALTACHAINIYHRDLKPENLLLSGNFQLKLSDFGLSNMTESDDAVLQTECGTKSYMAPEIISHQAYSGAAVDVWSAGVVLFIMLCGNPPFDIAARTDWWFNAISMNRYDRFWAAHLRAAAHMRTNAIAQNYVNGILRPNPADRPTLDQLKNEEWYKFPILSDSELYKTMNGKQNIVRQAKKAEAQASRGNAANSVDPFSRNTHRSAASPPPCDSVVASKLTTVYTSIHADSILDKVYADITEMAEAAELKKEDDFTAHLKIMLPERIDEFEGESIVIHKSSVSMSVSVYTADVSADSDVFAVSFIREAGDMFEFHKVLQLIKNSLSGGGSNEKEELLESSMSMI